MGNSVIYELTVFGGAGVAGVLIAFVYDMFRLKRRMVRTTTVLVHIEDIIFWVIAAIILFLSSYIISSGEMRVYFYAGAILGGALYFGTLSKPILWLLTALIKILAWPLIKIFEFIKPIIKSISIRLEKATGRMKNRVAIERYRTKVDFKRLKHTFTKK